MPDPFKAETWSQVYKNLVDLSKGVKESEQERKAQSTSPIWERIKSLDTLLGKGLEIIEEPFKQEKVIAPEFTPLRFVTAISPLGLASKIRTAKSYTGVPAELVKQYEQAEHLIPFLPKKSLADIRDVRFGGRLEHEMLNAGYDPLRKEVRFFPVPRKEGMENIPAALAHETEHRSLERLARGEDLYTTKATHDISQPALEGLTEYLTTETMKRAGLPYRSAFTYGPEQERMFHAAEHIQSTSNPYLKIKNILSDILHPPQQPRAPVFPSLEEMHVGLGRYPYPEMVSKEMEKLNPLGDLASMYKYGGMHRYDEMMDAIRSGRINPSSPEEERLISLAMDNILEQALMKDFSAGKAGSRGALRKLGRAFEDKTWRPNAVSTDYYDLLNEIKKLKAGQK